MTTPPLPDPEEFVTLPRTLFPESEPAARLLRCLFPDRAVRVVEETKAAWRFGAAPVSRAAALHDGSLQANLAGEFGLTFEHVSAWYRLERFGRVIWLEAFNHCWALNAWANCPAAHSSENAPLLLHLDAHDDLGQSALLCTETPGVLTAAIGETELYLDDPVSVAEFLHRGLIGIGSFLLPFLWARDGCEIFHVAPKALYPESVPPQRFILHPAPSPFGSAFSHISPPRPERDEEILGPTACFTYTRTADMGAMERLNPAGRPVLLDIDLDYFALLPSRTPPGAAAHCPSPGDALAQVEQLGVILRRSGLAPHIAAVTIAYSPGFFPSALWNSVLPALRETLTYLREDRP